jgi:malate dehydrogenase (quinone)
MRDVQDKEYDVVIVGAGVTGTALLYVLSKYTDVRRIALIEKYAGVAEVSSHAAHNSQTLHFGDIETNYTLEKARKVKEAAEIIVAYAGGPDGAPGILHPMQKMVLGVGEAEVEVLRRRAEEFAALFPEARLIGADELRRLEPKVMEGRDARAPVAAVYSARGFGADFGRLAASFVDASRRIRGADIDISFGRAVSGIRRDGGTFVVETDRGGLRAGAVVVAAGAHSLRMAQAMGFGKEYTLLPVAGDFFTAANVLRGKVYTMQEKKLPFAAVHGDPDVMGAGRMRFGPIARAVPLLEPGRWSTIFDFFRIFRPDRDTMKTVAAVNSDPVICSFIVRHLLYYLPFVGRYFFLRDARKIVPTMKASDLRFERKLGGVRPQVADVRAHELLMGEAKIAAEGIIFNITPSPGASVCLKNAEDDARRIIGHFGGRFRFDEARLAADLHGASSRA